jgi:hypothetical protein
MAVLNTNERQVLEALFQMGSGYVLNFSDRTMGEFFRDDIGIDIYDQKYNYASGSKANRLRGLWQVGDDKLVGRSIRKLLEYIEHQALIGRLKAEDFPQPLRERAQQIANRLTGTVAPAAPAPAEDEFISREFKNVAVDTLGLEPSISGILNQRLNEIRKSLAAKAPPSRHFPLRQHA